MYVCVLEVSIWPFSIIIYWICRQYRIFFLISLFKPFDFGSAKDVEVHNESRPEYS
jgi:hypothetical protein